MIRFTTRFLALLVLCLALLGTLAAPALASPGGNSAASAACENGGYRNYTDADGNPFRNAGQCVRYAAQNHDLVPVPMTLPTLTAAYADGFATVTGRGLLVGADVVITGITSTGVEQTVWYAPVDADGNYDLHFAVRCGWTNIVWSSITAGGEPISTGPGATQPCP